MRLDSTRNLDTGCVYMLVIEMFPGTLLSSSMSMYDSKLKQLVPGLCTALKINSGRLVWPVWFWNHLLPCMLDKAIKFGSE